ncbi:cation transporter [Paracoccus sp. (in: a-proteobacteria)]|uniref:cation diffusion facilitator family transporter n=1 Tax=Paracoccus sp. TaxID=267 RepID=UPI00321FC754
MRNEQQVLRLSIAVTFAMAGFGVIFGLLSGSASIVFDGVYTALDASMTLLALMVSRLIARSPAEQPEARLARHFTMGFWHLEPMVLGLSGTMLIGMAGYGLITSIASLLQGGRALHFDRAMVFAAVSLIAACAMAAYGRRANRRIGSMFLELDAKAWTISAALSGALLAAFLFGWLIQGTGWDWMTPYVDPAALALVCLMVLPAPVPTVRQALADILLVTPQDLLAHVRQVAGAAVARHGFVSHHAYVARVGRGRQIEIYFVVPAGQPPRRLEEWDAIRDEIGRAIGDEGPDRWLTIAFTTDPEWAV